MLNFKIKTILIFLLLSSSLMGQNRTVEGTVLDELGMGLPGVSVSVKGTTRGMITDVNGKFSVSVSSENDVLVFRFLGYKTIEELVGNRATMNVSMVPDVVDAGEVVVVAYGTQDTKSITGSVTQLTAEKIKERPVTSPISALGGSAPGIQVTTSTGQPGDNPAIRLRGIGSVNGSNDPLFVVDGVPFSGNINRINPDDIESISTLKDAASTSLYGARAANGVVIITTKKGRKNQAPSFSFSTKQGVSARGIQEYERINPLDFYQVYWEALRNDKITQGRTEAQAAQEATNELIGFLNYNATNVANNEIIGTDGSINPNARIRYSENDLDWFDPIERLGYRQEYNFSAQGASERADYYASFGYLNEKGVFENSDFERYTLRTNVNVDVLDWLRVGMNNSGDVRMQNTVTSGGSGFANAFYNARRMGPIFPVYAIDDQGNYIIDPMTGSRAFDRGDARFGIPRRPNTTSGRHAPEEMLLNNNYNESLFFRTVAFAEIKPMEDLSITLNGSVDIGTFNGQFYGNPFVGDYIPVGRASRSANFDITSNFNQLINYSFDLSGNHNFDVLFGHESYSVKNNDFNAAKTGYIVLDNPVLDNYTTIVSANSQIDRYKTEGYFSRINYNHNERYYASVSIRRDGTSRFSRDARWGNFWSVGASWRITQEDFMNSVSWIDELKLRASYGETGNDNVGGFYPSQTLYSSGRNNAANPGFYSYSVGNTALVWEKNTSADVAIDFEILGKVRGTIEYFNRYSDNLLFSVPIPRESGYTSQNRNIGRMVNKGLEFDINVDIIKSTSGFEWNFGLNATMFSNEITRLPEDSRENGIITGTKKLLEGRSIYDFWLRDWYGVDPDTGEPLYVYDPESEEAPNNVFKTVDGVQLTNNQNHALYTYNGSSIPDVYGAFTNTVSFKNFTLSVLFSYSIGGKIYDSNYQSLMSTDDASAVHKDIAKRWKQPGDITDVPKLSINNDVNIIATSDRWLTDASYLNLRNINLGYQFQRSTVQNLGLNGLRMYVSAENLFWLSARKGMNPMETFNGTQNVGLYPPSRVITLGVNLNF
ncbi:SusC/RagA family TonB-linked outer membrane protein [Roseivirga sp. UBA838]|uniref:SusC/RagA family TonB-linked outer membrane protein n=1 Tax=Roseivirga sp. UBA838 TaxID=1947393 RepID=UPI00257AE92E|nr:SusC/RagA family TonB-linked outer membrane protein [Roseivirga sp. UBA838]|tara:strand:+ start:2309 stop:5467 length:3159 start_codon:yes stop_codon:yes gene_type:complete